MPDSWDNYPLNYRPATVTDIFAGFESIATEHEFFIRLSGKPFSEHWSLRDWDEAVADGVDWRFTFLRLWLSNTYHTRFDKLLWRKLWSDPDKTTIGDVCRFVVDHGAVMLEPKPLRVAGRECAEAGVFMTFRSAITQEDAPDQSLTPSMSINQVGRRNADLFIQVLLRISPHHASRLKVRPPWVVLVFGLPLLTLLVIGVAMFIASLLKGGTVYSITWYHCAGVSISSLLALMLLWRLPPRQVEIEGLTTMADLSREIAKNMHQTST